MSILTYSREEYNVRLATAEPIVRPKFDRLYAAIARAVAMGIPPDGRGEELSQPIEDYLGVVTGRTKMGRTRNASEYFLGILFEGNKDFIDFGVIACASVFDLPSAEDTDSTNSYILTVNGVNHYITDEHSGESINPTILRELTAEIELL